MKNIKLMLTITAMLLLLTNINLIAVEGDDGVKGSIYQNQYCDDFDVLVKNCDVVQGVCTGSCIFYSYDRGCGECKNFYTLTCQSYVGRVAVRTDSGWRECNDYYYSIFGFPYSECDCPPMGTPGGEGTLVNCPCA